MRSTPLTALFLTAVVAGGCDALGGSMSEGGGGGGSSFTVASKSPGGGSLGVPVGTYVEVRFDGTIDTTSVDPGSLVIETVPAGSFPFGSVTVDGQKLRFTPSADLVPGTEYAATLSPDLRGTNGHLLGPVEPWGFKTAGPTPPIDTTPPLGPRPR